MNKFDSLSVKDHEYQDIINDILTNETVLKMKNFNHHYDTSCFDHCMNVSYYCYLICKKYNLNYTAAARAGMLHDLFLYDWHLKDPTRHGLHGFTHPKVALNNSLNLFSLSSLEQDIIEKHMWPLTIKLPKFKESYIITLVDKYCALAETFNYYQKNQKIKIIQRYAYVFFSLLIFEFI